MTELATVRWIYLVVAHQAVRHLRHVGCADGIRFFQPSVACGACIAGVQERPDLLAVMSEVSLLVDGRCDHRRDISELQMFLVAEFLERRLLREDAARKQKTSRDASLCTRSARSSCRHRLKRECFRPPIA